MMKNLSILTLFIFLIKTSRIICWTDEDLQLFDLVESTDRKFYDILGVDQKASANDIRKAYRKLSQQYHPDKNKEPDAEETFRKIAAIAEVLRNEEQRKKYDVILQTGLPDWKEPVYYYRRVRNMGLIELIFFLFCLATLGQYLVTWAIYWERKYEFEEVFQAKQKKKAKQERKVKHKKVNEETNQVFEEFCDLPKPRWQDLFPVRLFYFFIHVIVSSPSYLKTGIESLKSFRNSPPEEVIEEEEDIFVRREPRPKVKKHLEPVYPEFRETGKFNMEKPLQETTNGQIHTTQKKINSDANIPEFKKALKKFPNGTLQRWEKIAEYLECPTAEVVQMAKSMKIQQFTKNVPLSSQGLTGIDDFQDMSFTNGKLKQNGTSPKEQNGISHCEQNGTSHCEQNGTVSHRSVTKGDDTPNGTVVLETVWKQEEQRLLEVALQYYPKETSARWDRISEAVPSKTKEECIARYKWLAQEIKRKKGKEN